MYNPNVLPNRGELQCGVDDGVSSRQVINNAVAVHYRLKR